MHVKELARIAGTTPRAVRYYHHLGLLEIPPTVRGRREYGVEHVARLGASTASSTWPVCCVSGGWPMADCR